MSTTYAITEDPRVAGLWHYTLTGPHVHGGTATAQRVGSRAEVEAHVQAIVRRLDRDLCTTDWPRTVRQQVMAEAISAQAAEAKTQRRRRRAAAA